MIEEQQPSSPFAAIIDKYFITFGSAKPNYEERVKIICHQANEFGVFTKILGFTTSSLQNDKEFWNKHGCFLEENKRGYGYWLWKPYIIQKTLHSMKNGDFLVYADSGCYINCHARLRFMEYFHMVKESEFGILAFHMPQHSEKQYTKKETLNFFDCLKEEDFKKGQFMATVVILKKCEHSVKIVEEWWNTCSNNTYLLDDHKNAIIQNPEFIDHRHDQSIYSLLIKKHGAVVLNDETFFAPNWADKGHNYPFWAARIRSAPLLPFPPLIQKNQK